MLQNLHRRLVLCSASQIFGGDFEKICGLLRIYEFYLVRGFSSMLTSLHEDVLYVMIPWAQKCFSKADRCYDKRFQKF